MKQIKQNSTNSKKARTKETIVLPEQELLAHENLSPIQWKVLSLHLLEGKNWKEASEIAQISYSTVNNWLNRPEGESFRKALDLEKQVLYQKLRSTAENITSACYELLSKWLNQVNSKRTKLTSQEVKFAFQIILQTGSWEFLKKNDNDIKKKKIIEDFERTIEDELNKYKNNLELEYNNRLIDNSR
ncbi:MAG: sigma-70 region 4 domain-containing protein [Leptospiraceae bacterium]|nr:sigma-70 region 4 domain-containing protein [Leptospiraceae bacterium]